MRPLETDPCICYNRLTGQTTGAAVSASSTSKAKYALDQVQAAADKAEAAAPMLPTFDARSLLVEGDGLIQEVEMEEEEEDYGGVAGGGAAGSSKQGVGGSGDEGTAAAAVQRGLVSSRWGSLEDENDAEEEGGGSGDGGGSWSLQHRAKRSKWGSLDEEGGEEGAHRSSGAAALAGVQPGGPSSGGGVRRGGLKSSGGAATSSCVKKRVRWRDQKDEEEGFRIGGAAVRQVGVVFLGYWGDGVGL